MQSFSTAVGNLSFQPTDYCQPGIFYHFLYSGQAPRFKIGCSFRSIYYCFLFLSEPYSPYCHVKVLHPQLPILGISYSLRSTYFVIKDYRRRRFAVVPVYVSRYYQIGLTYPSRLIRLFYYIIPLCQFVTSYISDNVFSNNTSSNCSLVNSLDTGMFNSIFEFTICTNKYHKFVCP